MTRLQARRLQVAGLSAFVTAASVLAVRVGHAQVPPRAVEVPKGFNIQIQIGNRADVAPVPWPVAGGPRPGSSFYPETDYAAETILRNAENNVRAGQWADAIDLYQRVIREHGGALVAVPNDPASTGGTTLFIDVSRYCQTRIARLPPEALGIYRERVDPEADSLLALGLESDDLAPLRRVVSDYFFSAAGAQAAERLGDHAFRAGRFAEAVDYYRMVAPIDPQDADGSPRLVHPDPNVPASRVAAKLLLCQAAQGRTPSDSEIEKFRVEYPEARGHLAGRDGEFGPLLTAAIAGDHLGPLSILDGRWPTFGGGPDRNGSIPDPLDVGDLQWRVPLGPVEASGSGPNRARSIQRPRIGLPASLGGEGDDELSTFPILVGDQAIVCDDVKVTAYRIDARPGSVEGQDVASAVLAWESRLPAFDGSQRPAGGSGRGGRNTLTSHEDRIYARLGGPSGRGGGTLLALENNREVEGKLIWSLTASQIDLPPREGKAEVGFSPAFEGSPVADDRRVYIGLTEAATETWAYVAALDADTGETAWVQYLGNAASAFDQTRNIRLGSGVGHRLLSLSGQTIYYQTNMGAVAALDAETGSIRWVATYPTRDLTGGSSIDRGLNPALVEDGRVIVAPESAAELFAFDAADGHFLWKSQALEDVVHLLGVSDGRLFASGDRLYTIDAANGAILRAWPDAGAGYQGYGRGLLAGDRVCWPTRTEIHVLDQATGGNEHATIPLFQAFGHGGGNLAAAGGYLAVAEKDDLVIYCENKRLIERYQEWIVQEPEVAAHRYRLARLAEGADRPELALASLEAAMELAGPDDLVDGRPLAEAARDRRFGLLRELGDRDAQEAKWTEAAARFEAASEAARTDRERLGARLSMAEALESAGDPTASAAILQGLLADERLAALSVEADPRRSVRADLLIADRLDRLITRCGRTAYDRFDREAARLLERGRSQGDARLLREVVRSYPTAEVAPRALLELGRIHETADRPVEAASAYKRLLASTDDDGLKARALWGLGNAYEALGYEAPALEVYRRAVADYKAVDLGPLGVDGTVGSLVEARLARPEFVRLMGAGPGADLPLPLIRRREGPGAIGRPLVAEGTPTTPGLPRVFEADGDSIRPAEPENSESTWSADLGGEPVWAGYLADRLLAASATRLIALDPEDGRELWSYSPRPNSSRLDPFARDLGGPGPPEEATGRLHGFRIAGDRVLLMRGDRELLALDAGTGGLGWSYRPSSGGINEQLSVTPSRLAIQAGEPLGLVVIDPLSGKARAVPRGDRPPARWLSDPHAIDDDRLAVALGPRRVALIDLVRGDEVWTYDDDSALPRLRPALAIADEGRLYALYGGNSLVRLNPDNGDPLWTRPLGPADLDARPDALVIEGRGIYAAIDANAPGQGARLAAFDAVTGKPTWSRTLAGPDSGWVIALASNCLAVYPRPEKLDPESSETLPLLICRREDGEPIQRLLFPASGGPSAVRLDLRPALVATPLGLWSLLPPGPP